MASRPNDSVLRFLNRLFENHKIAGLSDRQLLRRFAADRDEDAFTLLVRRHGGMVLGVCHRVLGNASEAEDAFQATFLVLARKSSSIGWHDSVGNWLYGVALRVASKMRSQRLRVTSQETAAATGSTALLPGADAFEAAERELIARLDLALQRLPAKLRAPLVLCYLEGKSHQEAARELGLPPGSMSRHLARGLELLRERLAGRELLLSTDALAGLLARGVWRVLVERSLAETTTRAALCYTMGALAAGGAASVRVLTLTQGVIRTMIFTQLKLLIGLVLAAGVLGAGGYLQIQQQGKGQQAGVAAVENAGVAARSEPGAPSAMEGIEQAPPAVGFAEKLRKHALMQTKLDKPVVLDKGLDIMNFADARQYFEDRFDISIVPNPKAFKQSEWQEAKVQLDKMSGISLRNVLQMLVDQFGASYRVRQDYVEITKPLDVQTEEWVMGDRTLVPQANAEFQNVSLEQALKELAFETGITIVLDQTAYKEINEPTVTALLDGVCLDTAVELLANMCGMKSVALDRALYVTSQLKAEGLIEEREARSQAREKLEEKKQKEREKAEAKKNKA